MEEQVLFLTFDQKYNILLIVVMLICSKVATDLQTSSKNVLHSLFDLDNEVTYQVHSASFWFYKVLSKDAVVHIEIGFYLG